MVVEDWSRILVVATLATGLLIRIYFSTEKLLEWRIGSTIKSVYKEELMLPSITFCRLKLLGTSTKSENITADYNALPQLKDMLFTLTQRVTVENG